MAEHSRGRQMVFMATRPRYHVAKLLELNQITTVRDEDVRPSNDANLKLVSFSGKQCHAIIYDSGDYPDMQITVDKLVDYERKLSQYRSLGSTSQGVQTELDGDISEEPASYQSFTELRSALDTFGEHSHESFYDQGWVPGTFDEELTPEREDPYAPSTSNRRIGNEPMADGGGTPDFQSQIQVTLAVSEHEGAEMNTKRPKDKPMKKHCIFCRKDIGNLSRHLLDKHQEQERVQQFMNLPPKHPKRLELLTQLRVEGYTLARDTSIPVRQGGKHPYMPCPKCGAYYSKRGLYKHHNKCTGTTPPKNLVSILHTAQQIEKFTNVDIPEAMKKHILPKLKADELLLGAIVNDKRIIDYGNDLCLRFGEEIHKQGNLVRQKLRTLAQIKLMMAEEDQDIKSIEDVFQQSRWAIFINSVIRFSKLNETDLQKKSPTQVRNVGLLFHSLARDIYASYSPEDEIGTQKRNRIQGWVDLFNRKYGSTIGWQANKLTIKKKWKSKKRIPLASDVCKLNTYIKNKLRTSTASLKNEFNLPAWEEGNKAAMLALLLFNRKRKGELENITLDDFNNKSLVEQNSEIFKGMTETEKLMSSRYYHLVIRGKFVRPVPILINKEIATDIDLLLKYRNEAGVKESNKLLFAKPSGDSFDVNIALRDAAYDCGAECPKDLNSTGLRKHIATVSQALELTDNDLQTLCGFLGHTAKTHLEYYRMPSDVTHTARLSKVLESFDRGEIHKYRGKTIDEIDIEDDVVSYKSDDPDEPSESFHVKDVQKGGSKLQHTFLQTPPKKRKQKTMQTNDYFTKPSSPHQATPSKVNRSPTKKGTPVRRRIRWSTPEKRVMKRAFSSCIANGTLPSFQELHDLRLKEKVLIGRKPTTMKAWVSNQIRKHRDFDD